MSIFVKHYKKVPIVSSSADPLSQDITLEFNAYCDYCNKVYKFNNGDYSHMSFEDNSSDRIWACPYHQLGKSGKRTMLALIPNAIEHWGYEDTST